MKINKMFSKLAFLLFAATMVINVGCTTDDVAPEEENNNDDKGGNQGDVDKPVTLTFDFTSASQITNMGLVVPDNGKGSPITTDIVSEQLTLSHTNAEGVNPVRLWATGSGVIDLRVYKGDTLTFTVPEDYSITTLSWTSANAETIDSWTPSVGSISGGVWTASEDSLPSIITLTATATTRINAITVSYEKRKTANN